MIQRDARPLSKATRTTSKGIKKESRQTKVPVIPRLVRKLHDQRRAASGAMHNEAQQYTHIIVLSLFNLTNPLLRTTQVGH